MSWQSPFCLESSLSSLSSVHLLPSQERLPEISILPSLLIPYSDFVVVSSSHWYIINVLSFIAANKHFPLEYKLNKDRKSCLFFFCFSIPALHICLFNWLKLNWQHSLYCSPMLTLWAKSHLNLLYSLSHTQNWMPHLRFHTCRFEERCGHWQAKHLPETWPTWFPQSALHIRSTWTVSIVSKARSIIFVFDVVWRRLPWRISDYLLLFLTFSQPLILWMKIAYRLTSTS